MSGRNPIKEVALKEFKRALVSASDMGAKELHITGGEPLLRKDFLEISKFGVETGFNVRVQTNGHMLDRALCNALEKIGIGEVMISLDGCIPSTHDSLRGFVGSHEIVIKSIKHVISSGLPVRVNSVVFRLNSKEMPRLLEMTYSFGVSAHSFFYGSPVDTYTRGLWLSPAEWMRFAASLKRKTSELEGDHEMDVIIEKGYEHPSNLRSISLPINCKMLTRKHCILMPDGEVFPCVLFANRGISLGNITSQALTDIWSNSQEWSYYEKAIDDSHCKACAFFDFCRGGCKGYANMLSEESSLKDARCDRAEGLVPLCPVIKMNVTSGLCGMSTAEVVDSHL